MIHGVTQSQITHPDDDHVGNASAFLKEMVKKKISDIVGCTVSYSRIPDVIPEIEIFPQSQKQETWPGDKKSAINSIFDKAEYKTPDWASDLGLAGITPLINLIPNEKDWEMKKIKAGGSGWEWEREGTDGIRLFFGQDVSTGKNPYVPELMFATTFTESAFERCDVAVAMDKKKRVAKRSRNKSNMANTQVPIRTNKDLTDRLTEIETMRELEWQLPAQKKKKKDKHLESSPGPLSVLALPRVVVRSDITRDVVEVTKRNDPPHLDSVKRVIQLRNDISDLNETIGFDPKLKSNVAKKGDAKEFKLPDGTLTGRIETRGPDGEAYSHMMRQIFVSRLYLFEEDVNDPNFSLDGETVNRSPIITLFERRNARKDTIFSMLFTGDAFDHACDITHTIMAWDYGDRQPTIQFDVLKVPHHGSDNTTDFKFYSYCRANVYLICGDHRNQHGNPKLSSLLAIIYGFKGIKARGGQPFRMFFSNAHARDMHNNIKPCITGLLDGDKKYHPNQPSTSEYYFEMYYTKDLKHKDYAAFGSICFGLDKNNNLVTQWDPNQSVFRMD